MPGLPSGTVTLLFTDIEGSTQLLHWLGERYAGVLRDHHRLLRLAFGAWDGVEVDNQGDSFFVAFATAADAVAAAVAAQRALAHHPWPDGVVVRVRMGLHTGEPANIGERYVGVDVHRAARIGAAAHGGQVLLSPTTRALVADALPAGVALRDLGPHRLKDLAEPQRLYQLVVDGLPADFPPPRTLDRHAHNLPVQPTALVGREREVASVRDLLRRPGARLLTLTGPGGTGKTRLALQVAAEGLDDYPDGAWFVDLAPLANPALVASAVAAALGVTEVGGRALEERLADALRERRLLLVLDNFEQVLDAAPLVDRLLAAAPSLTALATSRAPLRVYGEQEYPAPPLALPDPQHLPPPERLAQYAAVRLFVERAQAVTPDFRVTDENAPALAEICRRLDGLPLAIELAAARIRLLTPQAILARLERRLALLTGGARTLPTRHQALRATIEWSHGLLDEGERALFACLAVFAGGATLEAVEAVCDLSAPPGSDVLVGLESLVAQSLLRREEGANGEPVFAMLETIREYALERLEAVGEAAEVRRRHADYYLAVAERTEAELGSPRRAAWLARLEQEHADLVAALGWALERGDAARAVGLAWGLSRFWLARGRLSEGRHWLEAVLARGGGLPTPVRLRALRAAGALASEQGDYTRAGALLEEAHTLVCELGDAAGIARSLLARGDLALHRGDRAGARDLYEQSLARWRALGDRRGVAGALNGLGLVAEAAGDEAGAAALLGESLALLRELGDRRGVAYMLMNLALPALRRGDHARAGELYEESLALHRALSDPLAAARARANLAGLVLERGDAAGAAAAARETLRLAREWGDHGLSIGLVEHLATAAAMLGQAERAARLGGAAEALRESLAMAPPPFRRAYERHVAARARLGETSWAAAWADGRALSMERAVAEALEEAADA